jgi:hypothetical protein
VKRTQLYLDDDLWNVLHLRARREGTTVSDLVRNAARERYLGKLEQRKAAMQALMGIRRDRSESADSVRYVRRLRRGRRIDRLDKP